jgi:voltage-gated potassium channel
MDSTQTVRREELLRKIDRVTDVPLTLLAICIIPLLVAPYLLDLSSHTRSVLAGLDYLIWGVFASVFAIKIVVAPNRIKFLRSSWFDAVLVVLPMFRPLRSLRLFRIGVVVAAGGRVATVARDLGQRKGLQFAAAAALTVILVFGSLVTVTERDEADSTIHDISDGLWWATTTVTTVGYGDTYPKSDFGRGIGVALMIIGIALFGTVTASMAAYFVEQKEDGLANEIKLLRADIKELRDRLDE